MHRLGGLSEQFALVGDSLRRLFPFGESFAAELQTAVQQTQQAQAAPPAPLAMEVATSLLYLEAALEDGDFDQPEHAERVKRLGERLSLGAPEAAARAARAVDGGALPARLRPADDGQRRPGAARLALRGREVDRQVLPQPGRPRRAARRAGAARARCAACSRCSAWTRRRRRCCACATRSTAWSRPRSIRSRSSRPACSSAWPATCRRSAS